MDYWNFTETLSNLIHPFGSCKQIRKNYFIIYNIYNVLIFILFTTYTNRFNIIPFLSIKSKRIICLKRSFSAGIVVGTVDRCPEQRAFPTHNVLVTALANSSSIYWTPSVYQMVFSSIITGFTLVLSSLPKLFPSNMSSFFRFLIYLYFHLYFSNFFFVLMDYKQKLFYIYFWLSFLPPNICFYLARRRIKDQQFINPDDQAIFSIQFNSLLKYTN